jgi:hypothetical protein
MNSRGKTEKGREKKNMKRRGSAVGIATGYGIDGRGVAVRVPAGAKFSSLHVVQTGSGYRGLFPREQSGRDVKLTSHLQPVPRSRIRGYIHPPPIRLIGVVIKWLSIRTLLIFLCNPSSKKKTATKFT